MTTATFKGLQGTIVVDRHPTSVFYAKYVGRDGREWEVTWPPLPGALAASVPFYPIVCGKAECSAGSSLLRLSTPSAMGKLVGWKRRKDALVAAEAMVAVLGVEPVAGPIEIMTEEREEGVRVWFSGTQLLLLQKLVQEGAEVTPMSMTTEAHLAAIVDRVDCAVRALAARHRNTKKG